MYVDPEITNTDPFGVSIKTGANECDAITTRLYLLNDEKNWAQSFQFRVADISESVQIDDRVDWVYEFEEDKIFMTVDSTIFIIEDWLDYHEVKDPRSCNYQKYFITPIPRFSDNFPFIVCTGFESISIVNVNTKQIQTLINSPCKHIYSQQAIFFMTQRL